jgi:hypothetical protein
MEEHLLGDKIERNSRENIQTKRIYDFSLTHINKKGLLQRIL